MVSDGNARVIVSDMDRSIRFCTEVLGLDLDLAISIERAVARLAEHSVPTKGPITHSDPGAFVSLEDPDGNKIPLWEQSPLTQHDQDLATASI